MILKIVRQKKIYNDKEGEASFETAYYESKSFNKKDDFIFTDKDTIPLTDLEGIDEITGKNVELSIQEAYLMNNEGKTIERIV